MILFFWKAHIMAELHPIFKTQHHLSLISCFPLKVKMSLLCTCKAPPSVLIVYLFKCIPYSNFSLWRSACSLQACPVPCPWIELYVLQPVLDPDLQWSHHGGLNQMAFIQPNESPGAVHHKESMCVWNIGQWSHLHHQWWWGERSEGTFLEVQRYAILFSILSLDGRYICFETDWSECAFTLKKSWCCSEIHQFI